MEDKNNDFLEKSPDNNTKSSPSRFSPPKASKMFSTATISSSFESSFNNRDDRGEASSYFLTVTSTDGKGKDKKTENNTEKDTDYIYASPPKRINTDLTVNSSIFTAFKTTPEGKDLEEALDKRLSGSHKIFEKLFKSHKDKNTVLRSGLEDKKIQNKFQIREFEINEELNDETNEKLTINQNEEKKKIIQTPSLEISITGYVIKNLIFPHVKYTILIVKKEAINKTIKLQRRYSDFLKLREMLVNRYVGVFIPSLPLKENFGNKDIALIEFRKKFLQIFMHEIQICYFFKESEEIQSFLDPGVEDFPAENLLIQSRMTNESEDLMFEETLKVTRNKICQNYIDNQTDYLSTQVLEMNIKLPMLNPAGGGFNYKCLDPEMILKNIKNGRSFANMLQYKKTILENVLIILKHLIMEQKEHSNLKFRFLEEMRNFQNSFIFAMNDNISVFNYNSDKNLFSTDSSLKKMEDSQKKEKSFDIMLKNMHDWIYKEIINLDSCLECINSLNPFLDRLNQVNFEMKQMFKQVNEMKNQSEREFEYINFDVKEKLENKLEKLKEIVALNSLFINEVEISKYKSCRFVYFYNSLKFAYLQNKNYYKDQTLLSDCLLNIIGMMKMYLNNNFRYKKYFDNK